MRIKFIYIVFNIILVLFLLFTALVPYFMLGIEYTKEFWRSAWPIAAILGAGLVFLNVFFLMNHRLFWLLEREDWPALADYLEKRVVDRGHYQPRLVRLLVNSYVIMSDFFGALQLEKKIAREKPVLLEKNALVFGTARILSGDLAGAALFFRTCLDKKPKTNAQWIRWYYGFSLLLSGSKLEAETEFLALAASSNDALITGLSAWFLSETLAKHSLKRAECQDVAAQGRKRLREILVNIEAWNKETAKIESELHVLVIRRYLGEAALWLFRE